MLNLNEIVNYIRIAKKKFKLSYILKYVIVIMLQFMFFLGLYQVSKLVIRKTVNLSTISVVYSVCILFLWIIIQENLTFCLYYVEDWDTTCCNIFITLKRPNLKHCLFGIYNTHQNWPYPKLFIILIPDYLIENAF